MSVGYVAMPSKQIVMSRDLCLLLMHSFVAVCTYALGINIELETRQGRKSGYRVGPICFNPININRTTYVAHGSQANVETRSSIPTFLSH